MGTYLFERFTGEGAGNGASHSLRDDVVKALDEIDWVDHVTLHDERSNDEVVCADVTFEVEWPDIRTSHPDQVSEVFRRLGLRTIPNPALSAAQASADDPLSADPEGGDDAEAFDLFEFDE